MGADYLAADTRELLAILIEKTEKTNRLLEQIVSTPKKSEWVKADEAAAMLGRSPTPGGKRILQRARERGDLVTFLSRSPYIYSRKELEELLRNIQKNPLHLG